MVIFGGEVSLMRTMGSCSLVSVLSQNDEPKPFLEVCGSLGMNETNEIMGCEGVRLTGPFGEQLKRHFTSKKMVSHISRLVETRRVQLGQDFAKRDSE
jgi:hypothetical protein